jgi:hypothetical protein
VIPGITRRFNSKIKKFGVGADAPTSTFRHIETVGYILNLREVNYYENIETAYLEEYRIDSGVQSNGLEISKESDPV